METSDGSSAPIISASPHESLAAMNCPESDFGFTAVPIRHTAVGNPRPAPVPGMSMQPAHPPAPSRGSRATSRVSRNGQAPVTIAKIRPSIPLAGQLATKHRLPAVAARRRPKVSSRSFPRIEAIDLFFHISSAGVVRLDPRIAQSLSMDSADLRGGVGRERLRAHVRIDGRLLSRSSRVTRGTAATQHGSAVRNYSHRIGHEDCGLRAAIDGPAASGQASNQHCRRDVHVALFIRL